ncbi:unnamed protein product [Anisakis simplex]|uniref:PADR1 domain-containing protein n=1 Tax=Anisakis simplex TaxID=6269 RepID=A0A0M3JK17_ANISI|nr:unnamed protein product [Anisakis simplex]
MWKVREMFSRCLSKAQMQHILQVNKQSLPEHGGEAKLLDRLVDCAVFGCPVKCERCKNGQLVFRFTLYNLQIFT